MACKKKVDWSKENLKRLELEILHTEPVCHWVLRLRDENYQKVINSMIVFMITRHCNPVQAYDRTMAHYAEIVHYQRH